jgi:outer membrane lipoprotein-sorting protein
MAARGHGAARRWTVVAALVAVLAGLPALLGALPARDADLSATALRRAVLDSARVGFSGYAESAGGLSLPVSDQLTSVADLFSDRTTMRVWWRGASDNRVDVVTASGEEDVHRDRTGSWSWDYESQTATRALAAPLALPAAPDLLPSALGRRLLSEAAAGELSRLGARRIAGRDALGLRLVPSAEASSVARVDVWVDRGTGLPMRVQVFGKGARMPALDTRFIDLRVGRPAASVTAFSPPPGASVRESATSDLLREAARRLRPVRFPDTLLGLPRRPLADVPDGVALYGRGVTLLAVVPVSDRLADQLRQGLAGAPGAKVTDGDITVAAGPLSLRLHTPPFTGAYLVTGTVTLAALAGATSEVPQLEAGWLR